MGRVSNGDLLNLAESAGFDMLLTTGKNMRYQQNLTSRTIAIVVIERSQWPELRPHVQLVVDTVNAALPGSYIEVAIPV